MRSLVAYRHQRKKRLSNERYQTVSSACRVSQDKQLRGRECEVWSLGEKPETQIWVFGAEVAPSSGGSCEFPGELWARVESPAGATAH